MRLSREEAKQQTRTRLLDAALELLIEQGYENLTTGRIAKRAGMAQPTFYVHFSDMQELLSELAANLVRKLRRAFRESRTPLHEGGDVAAASRRTVWLALQTVVEHAGLLRLYMAEQLHLQSSIGPQVRQSLEAFIDDLADDLQRVPAAQDLPRARLRLFTQCIVASSIAAGLSVAEGRYPLDDELVGSLADSFVGMLGALLARPSVVAERPSL